MGHAARTRPRQFRRAVAGSVAVHVLLAAAVVVSVRSGGARAPAAAPPGLDTRAEEVVFRLSSVEVSLPSVEPDPPPEPVAPPQPQEATGDSRPAPVGIASRPVRTTVPNALSREALALVRRPTGVADTNVRPAAGLTARPFHGAMRPGQTVVYVLDCSGSMGEFGKLAAARAALAATLCGQPGDVRFQVITYNSTAKVVLPGGCVPASAANVAAADAGLAGLAASGRSNHTEAVRAAAALRPDVVVLLTDAADLTLAPFRAALAAAGKPVAVCVARVSAGGVAAPRELR